MTENSQSIVDEERDADTAYRQRVRNYAISGYHRNEWLLEELNASLQRLQLDPYLPRVLTDADLSIALRIHTISDHTLTGHTHLASEIAADPAFADDIERALSTVISAHSDKHTAEITIEEDSLTIHADLVTRQEV